MSGWFAWRPVRLENGKWRWLRRVRRHPTLRYRVAGGGRHIYAVPSWIYFDLPAPAEAAP